MSVDTARSLIHRGWLVLVVMVLLAVVSVGAAWVRNTDTNRLNDENQRLNRENQRLNGCVRDVIRTVKERSKYTQLLDEQDAADRKATSSFWTGIAAEANPARRRQIFNQYQAAGVRIEKRRAEILAERDTHVFPSLAECEKP